RRGWWRLDRDRSDPLVLVVLLGAARLLSRRAGQRTPSRTRLRPCAAAAGRSGRRLLLRCRGGGARWCRQWCVRRLESGPQWHFGHLVVPPFPSSTLLGAGPDKIHRPVSVFTASARCARVEPGRAYRDT